MYYYAGRYQAVRRAIWPKPRRREACRWPIRRTCPSASHAKVRTFAKGGVFLQHIVALHRSALRFVGTAHPKDVLRALMLTEFSQYIRKSIATLTSL